ncbi:MAG: dTDP-4-dehydrorhamnose reductase [candidate division Zixibacteria bacterium]|nr:dTDP-4-dehydrorhamnose reductase [candidate division Zixibacteria bacterium]
MPNKVLVTGANGQLGRALVSEFSDKYEVVGITRKDADITDKIEISRVISSHRPRYVLHTAAFTNVDRCETEPEKAALVNSTGTENVALACKAVNAKLVYFSTDYVFDGAKSSSYIETDRTNPINIYGRSKLDGESKCLTSWADTVIIRIGWIYSENGSNFLKKILAAAKRKAETARAAGEKPALKVVDDQIGTPTWTKDIAMQMQKLIERNVSGVYHVASNPEVSRFEFAREILTTMLPEVTVEPCSSSEYNTEAKRPLRSSLSCEKLKSENLSVMRPWQESLEEFLKLHGKQLLNEI